MRSPAGNDDWRAWYQRGLEADETDSAYYCFSQAIDAGADQWEPYYARAWITIQALTATGEGAPAPPGRQLEDAEKDLDRALDEFGAGSDAVALRAHVAALQGEHELAVELFLRAIGRSPQSALIEEGLADSLAKVLADLESMADDDGAGALAVCERLERMLTVAPVVPALADELLAEVLATQAYCHQAAGEADKCDMDLRRVAQLVPGHPRVPPDLPADGARLADTVQHSAAEPTFAAVGGLTEPGTFMNTLRQLFELYFGSSDTEAARRRLAGNGRSPTRSILLFGPSGCGKTYVIQSFAGEYRARFNKELPIVKLRLDTILNRYVGESEKAITRLIDQAIALQPSILFADEVDAIGKSREDGQDWRVDMAAHWLLEIDRLRDSGATVVFFGCTNRLWAIDLAMLRRFDRTVPVELPTAAVRAQIFDVCLQVLDPQVRSAVIDTSRLATAAHGLTPGDIRKVVNRALDDLMMAEGSTGTGRALTEDDILSALKDYRQPMHVSEWVRQSVNALRDAGQREMAEDVQRVYGPYVDDLPTLLHETADRGPAWQPIPVEAWREQPEFDLSSMRHLRRAP